MPVFICLTRDFFQLFLTAPIRKFISWPDNPTQYPDINAKADINNK